MCHTKTKYPLRQQGSFDTATAEPGGSGGSGGSGGRLTGKGRSRSEERLHGCRLTGQGMGQVGICHGTGHGLGYGSGYGAGFGSGHVSGHVSGHG